MGLPTDTHTHKLQARCEDCDWLSAYATGRQQVENSADGHEYDRKLHSTTTGSVHIKRDSDGKVEKEQFINEDNPSWE